MLLEREKEREVLHAALGAACAGEGSVVLLAGETGVGKSELLLGVEDRAFDLGMTTLVARGTELDRDRPFGIVLQLLERLVTALPAAERDALADGPARMALPLFPALRTAGDAAAEDPLALVHGAYWLVARIAELRPLVLLVDDVQWADERSVQVLRYLAARIEDLPAALVLAGTSGLDPVVRGSATAVTLRVTPLTEAGVTRMVLSEFPDADAAFCAGCASATAGVPLLVEELLASVRADARPPTGATAARFGRLSLRAVARAVLERLEALPAGTPALARTAAVLGDDADLTTTAGLAGMPVARAVLALEALCATGIVEPDETIRFRHPIVRSALEASVPPAGRARTHLQAAHVLLGDAAPPERVAGHLMAAERGGRRWVVTTLRRAADRAMADGAPASAARYLERALDEPPDPQTRAAVLLALARAEAAAGSPRAPARIRAALAPVATDARPAALAELVGVPAAGDRPALVASFEEALRRGAGDPEATRWLEATLLAEARAEPRLRRRATALLGVAGDADPQTPSGRALTAQRALEAALGGAPAEAVRVQAGQALGRGRLVAEDRPGGAHVAAALRALALADDLQSAELVAAVAVDRARDSGSPDAYARMCALRADVCLRRGSLADAVADARAALDAPAAAREHTAAAALAHALTEHGDFDEAAEALDASGGGDGGAGRAMLLLARAALRRRTGEHPEAHADALAAGDLARDLDADCAAWLPWRAEAALALAAIDPDAARALAVEHVAVARATQGPRTLGQALRVAGTLRGDLALLREAVTVLDGTHAALERASALAALGTALRDHGDPVASRAPLREALAIAQRCGAVVLEAEVGALLTAAGDRVRRVETDGLSPVERRVVDLATDGLGADEIADALFVTVKAVEWHLRSASRKLGADSREQLLASLSKPL